MAGLSFYFKIQDSRFKIEVQYLLLDSSLSFYLYTFCQGDLLFIHLPKFIGKKMGIKKKISLGFVIIGVILLLSSVIAIYEFVSMRRSVYSIMTENIASINSSRILLEVADEYNFSLLKSMGIDTVPAIPDVKKDVRFPDYLSQVKEKFTTDSERQMADSVLLAYTAYIHVIKDAAYIWQGDYKIRRDWYFDNLYPKYMALRGYIVKLTFITQKALSANSEYLTDSFYRSIMPGVVAVTIGMILIFLFNYFINLYFISPLIKISKGIKDFLLYRKSYNYTDINDDDLRDLSQNVKDLIEANRELSKSKQQESRE